MRIKNLCIVLVILITGNFITSCSPQCLAPRSDNAPTGYEIILDNRGTKVSEAHNLTGFSEIDVSALFEVEIIQGGGFEVITEVEEAAVPYLQVFVEDHVLNIGLDPSLAYNTTNAVLHGKITLPVLSRLSLNGISTAELTDFECSGSLDVEVRGVSVLKGRLSGCDLNLIAAESSEVMLQGSVKNVELIATNASEVDFSELVMENLESYVDLTSKLIIDN